MNRLRRLWCALFGHRLETFRRDEPCGHGTAATLGWRCRRCGHGRWGVTFRGLTQREFARAKHLVQQLEAKTGQRFHHRTTWQEELPI